MGGKATSAKLILAGMAVSAVCSAFSNFVIYITNDKNAATEVMKWTMGRDVYKRQVFSSISLEYLRTLSTY